MEYKIRELLKNKAMAAVLSVALGIVIIIARRAALDLLVRIIGGLVITGGIALIAVNLIRPNAGSGNMTTVLVMGGLAILAGIILISCAEGIVDFFPTLMGIFLILHHHHSRRSDRHASRFYRQRNHDLHRFCLHCQRAV